MEVSDDEELLPYNPENDFTCLFNYEDQMQTSPLLKAIANNDIEFVKARIESGQDFNIPNNYGNTPLHAAASHKSIEILMLLLELPNIDLNFKNSMGDTPLLLSLRMHQQDHFIEQLIEAGCNINIANNMKETPLHRAIARSTTCVAVELIKRKADINAVDVSSYSPLHHAVDNDNLEMVCMLLYYNADVTVTCLLKLTPFMYAVNDIDKLQIANVLFDYYVDFSCIAIDGFNALLLAANSRSPIAIDIAKADVDINWITPRGDSVLSFALYYDSYELFKTVWPKFDQLILLHCRKPLLNSLIQACCFPTSEWLECLYEILNSPFVADLIAHWTNHERPQFQKSVFKTLAVALFKRKVKLRDRLAIIQTFVRLGAVICVSDINVVNELYGFHEELEILIGCEIQIDVIGERYNLYPLPTFIFALDKGYSAEYVADLFRCQISHWCSTTNESTGKDIVRAVGFFSFPLHIKHELRSIPDLRSLKDAFLEKLDRVPEFPSLVELSRNEVRQCIKKIHKVKQASQFYNAVNNLNIPPLIKNILLFKAPIYE